MKTMNKAKEKSGAEKIRQHNPHSFATETKPNTSHVTTPRKIKQLRIKIHCRLKRLLNNIEEISEIESGIYCKDYKTYDIVNYLRELVNLCSEHTKQKNIDILYCS